MPYQGNTKSPRVLTEKGTNPFTFQKNPPAPGHMGNLCEMDQVTLFQNSKASSIFTFDHPTVSYTLNADSSWFESLARQHRSESCFDRAVPDRVLVPWRNLPEGPRIDAAGPPIEVLDQEGKDLGGHGSGE